MYTKYIRNAMCPKIFKIYDGDNEETANALHEGEGFGGKTRPKPSYTSKSGKFMLIFKTNPVRAATGWNVTFSASPLTRF